MSKLDEKQMKELLEHCKDCPWFEISTSGGNEEFYECSLLADERIEEYEEDDEFYESDGNEGLLAVAHYDLEGNLIDFGWMDDYPKGCPEEIRRLKNEKR